MICSNPIQLKNGLIVPCGKCLGCLSARRNDWSVRVQLHGLYTRGIPYFITLTYADENITYGAGDTPTLVKTDIQRFIKRLKENYKLYNTDFAWFSGSEYGDSFDRPHSHLILFNFDKLHDTYLRSWQAAQDMIRDVWQNGFVQVGQSDVGGIHYTCKYVLKYATEDFSDKQKPFMLGSNGLGSPWLSSPEAKYLKIRLEKWSRLCRNFDFPQIDTTDFDSIKRSAYDAVVYLRQYVPDMRCTLSNGERVPIPRYLRKKLVGTFENPADSPFFKYRSMMLLYRNFEYLSRYGEYDLENDLTMAAQKTNHAINKIKYRLIRNGQL